MPQIISISLLTIYGDISFCTAGISQDLFPVLTHSSPGTLISPQISSPCFRSNTVYDPVFCKFAGDNPKTEKKNIYSPSFLFDFMGWVSRSFTTMLRLLPCLYVWSKSSVINPVSRQNCLNICLLS